MPRTVAIDATPLLGPRTGVGEFCLGALGALADRPELEVSAFAVTWHGRGLLVPKLPTGIQAHQRATAARPLHASWRHVGWPPVEWFVGRVDVVHGTNYVVPPTRRAARVVTVHDLTPVRYPQMCDKASLRFPALIRRAVDDGAFVHTHSRFVADEIVAEFGVDPARVVAVHSGVPGVRGAAPGAPLAVHLPAGTVRYVLAVGTIEPRKDLPGLVRAFDSLASQCPDVALVIAGGDGWGADALDRALVVARHRRRVLRTGYVDDATLSGLISNASVLAYPSVYEGFGFPPLQAMDCGLPVVATAAGAVPEIVGDAALLVPVGDVAALAAALVAALDDEVLRRSLIERGRERVRRFTWEACAAGLSALYELAATA